MTGLKIERPTLVALLFLFSISFLLTKKEKEKLLIYFLTLQAHKLFMIWFLFLRFFLQQIHVPLNRFDKMNLNKSFQPLPPDRLDLIWAWARVC